MAPERTIRATLAAAVALSAAVALPAPARAGAWWTLVGLAGRPVTDVSVDGGIEVVSSGTALVSTDGGRTFSPPSASSVTARSESWVIDAGHVLRRAAGRLAADPGAPFLGEGAHLIAAPAALPGVVVAVGSDSHVWRRDGRGHWATSFIPLPAGGFAGTPAVTALAAFERPISAAVYLGTDGYGVLLSIDGGDDWIRADAGLPARVFGLATDARAGVLYAATESGLWAHHLQATPAPPVYRDAQLTERWFGIGGVALAATLLAVASLLAAVRDPRGGGSEMRGA